VLIMVLTDFTITAADVGRALGVPDGYLVNLAMTQGPAYETPRRVWRRADRRRGHERPVSDRV
jgi:hypothetical protein